MTWLSQEGSRSPKHRTWQHPILSCLVHFFVNAVIVFHAHDWMLDEYSDLFSLWYTRCDPSPAVLRNAIVFLGCYGAWLLGWRLWVHRSDPMRQICVFYEFQFLCNVTLVLAPLALHWNRPIIATAFCVAVGIDHLFWYIDVVSWCIRYVRTTTNYWMQVSLQFQDYRLGISLNQKLHIYPFLLFLIFFICF